MTSPPIDIADPVALTRALVRLDTRNPGLVAGAPGEGAAATLLADLLARAGFRVDVQVVSPGRTNVVACVGAALPGAPTLMFNGHLDVVGTEGMTHPPFEATIEEGRLYGRGATDMKSGVAAMCAAAARAASESGGLAGELIIAAVADEEFESIGTRHLVESGVRADAAIVTEPTGLAIMPAHRGFVWLDIVCEGRAAHGSRYELGIDAIRHMGLVLAELDALDLHELPGQRHPLLGHASLHASLIEGGSGMSTYPDRCLLRLERRTLPGQSPADVLAEVRAACERVRTRTPALRAEVELRFAQAPSDVAADAPIVRRLADALEPEVDPRIEGMSAWTDCAILNEAGIPAICFGPGDISLAHAATEWVAVDEIERATRVLTRLARNWCGSGVGSPMRAPMAAR